MIDHAIAYAEHGTPVFPVHGINGSSCSCRLRERCDNIGKHPATRNGVLDATTDIDQIRKVWNRYPYMNIGLATGVTFDALDLDGPDAMTALQLALADHGGWLMEDGTMVRTGRGWHAWYQPTGAGNRARVVAGVDWRGAGGYVLAPPSRHASGRTYEFVDWCANDTITAAPPQLIDLVLKRGPFTPTRVLSEADERALLERLDDEARHGPGGFNPEGLYRTMGEAQEGERNHVLYWCANRVVDAWIEGKASTGDYGQALGRLHDIASTIGLDDVEIERTINSARKADR